MLTRLLTLFKKSSITKAILLASTLVLAGCATPPLTKQLTENPPSNIPISANIEDLPFYPQQAYYCGPTVLAEIFEYHGIKLSPDEIAPQLFIPQRQGSLQLEMIAATRQQGLLAYAERGDFNKLLYFINNNIPVIVLQNLSIQWHPMWHYSVVKGYNLTTQQFIQHTGPYENRPVDFSVFERTWQRANYWFLIALPKKHNLSKLDPFTYITSAQDLLTVAQTASGIHHLTLATNLWPNYWLSYFLLGNYYLETFQHTKQLKTAISWYKKGYTYAKLQPHYLNNYAYALFKNAQFQQAKIIIEQAEALAPKNVNVLDTKAKILLKIKKNGINKKHD